MPDNQRDNGEKGYSSPCILEAYEFDGTRMWQINLGFNIRSGNHYTQFLVYDFDGECVALVHGDAMITLPSGIYVVTSETASRKVVVK